MNAVAAAGVTHSLARACARGLVEDCGCGPTPRGAPNVVSRERINGQPQKFLWAGCSDNLRYGNSFGRRFVDLSDRHKDPRCPSSLWQQSRALMNLHNNRVGRRLLATSQRRECKCHGVSGSCVTKTCWRVVPNFSSFALQLKDKYEHAQQVGPSPIRSAAGGAERAEPGPRPPRPVRVRQIGQIPQGILQKGHS